MNESVESNPIPESQAPENAQENDPETEVVMEESLPEAGAMRTPFAARRSAARLAAVQLLFQEEFSEVPRNVNQVIDGYCKSLLNNRTSPIAEETLNIEPDIAFLKKLLHGAVNSITSTDTLLFSAISDTWKPERMAPTVKAVLRAGIYELLSHQDIPANVIINEYIDIADAICEHRDAGFVNAVLDSIARKNRNNSPIS